MFASLIPAWEPPEVWSTNYINSVGINYVKKGKVKLNPLKFRLLDRRRFTEGNISPSMTVFFLQGIVKQSRFSPSTARKKRCGARTNEWKEEADWVKKVKSCVSDEAGSEERKKNISESEEEGVMRRGGRKQRKSKKAEITKNTDQVAILVFSSFFGNFLLRKYYFLSSASFLSLSFLPFVNLTSIHNISNSNNNNNHHQILSS